MNSIPERDMFTITPLFIVTIASFLQTCQTFLMQSLRSATFP